MTKTLRGFRYWVAFAEAAAAQNTPSALNRLW
jgi:hypothetical protein